jgi:putative SOS response-associated peptidase YedK
MNIIMTPCRMQAGFAGGAGASAGALGARQQTRYAGPMCGRFVTPDEASIEAFWTLGRRNWRSPFVRVRQARFNVAPQQGNPQNYVPVLRADADGALELIDMQWWLLPFWSKEARIKYATFNARVESVASSASFREPFRRRRCLIPARGWYEWQDTAGGKQPWYFQAADGALLAFAGLWDRWQGDGQVIESCTIIRRRSAVGAETRP